MTHQPSALIFKDQSVYFDGYDLTGRANAIALEYGCEPKDNTVLGSDSRSRLGGLKMATAQVEGYIDIDDTDKAMFNNMGAADKPISFGASADTAGSVAYTMLAVEGELNFGSAVGEVFPFSLGAENDGNLVRGTMMLNSKGTALTSTTNGNGYQVGAAAAGQTIYCALHVLGAGTGSCTVTIESDSTNDFNGAETTQITFDAATGVSSQFKTLAGAETDTYWRAVATISGGDPKFKLVIVLGIV